MLEEISFVFSLQYCEKLANTRSTPSRSLSVTIFMQFQLLIRIATRSLEQLPIACKWFLSVDLEGDFKVTLAGIKLQNRSLGSEFPFDRILRRCSPLTNSLLEGSTVQVCRCLRLWTLPHFALSAL